MSARDPETDAEVFASVAPATDNAWRELFAMPLWTQPPPAAGDLVATLVGHLYELGVVVPFDWPDWYSPDRYPSGRELESAPVADAVRLITSCVRGDRFSDGAFLKALSDGTIPSAVRRLWTWYRQAIAGDGEFVDHAEYSPDDVYRWSYERRWAPGGTLCWVGLNPGTGDTDSGQRPSLRKVVQWARREGCTAVTVVNLFSYRSTDPKLLSSATVDIVGERTDCTIAEVTARSQVTLAAWGGAKVATKRGAEVSMWLKDPMCVGTTQGGAPRHPLYVSASTAFTPYRQA